MSLLKVKLIKENWHLLLVSFIEGGAVMAIELIGAKIVAPFYGSSLYVWAAVLAVTLGGLTLGYYLGGSFSEKKDIDSKLFLIVMLTGFLTAIMPMTAPIVMNATLGLEIRLGITLSCLIFLFPPLVLCGMVSPIIIRIISTHVAIVGRTAGTIYAISTTGGIMATFLMGFLFIPFYGLKASSIFTAIALAICSLIYFLKRRNVSASYNKKK